MKNDFRCHSGPFFLLYLNKFRSMMRCLRIFQHVQIDKKKEIWFVISLCSFGVLDYIASDQYLCLHYSYSL